MIIKRTSNKKFIEQKIKSNLKNEKGFSIPIWLNIGYEEGGVKKPISIKESRSSDFLNIIVATDGVIILIKKEATYNEKIYATIYAIYFLFLRGLYNISLKKKDEDKVVRVLVDKLLLGG
tara:strand:+ start:178 stop:537 length:360 start_codon:yes stop_codon:yes gene_type:complete